MYEPVLVVPLLHLTFESVFPVVDTPRKSYAIRQAIAQALVAYYAKYIDASSAMELEEKLVLLTADPKLGLICCIITLNISTAKVLSNQN